MKKNELWVTTTITSAICLILSIVIILSGRMGDREITISLGQKTAGSNIGTSQQATQPTTQPTTQATLAATTQPATQPSTQDSSDVSGDNTTAPTDAPATSEPAATNTVPTGNEEILKKYNEIISKAKTSGPAHKKVEYQAIPEDKVNFGGGIFDRILPIASNFFTTEEDARANPEIREKGNDMYWFPPYKVQGCLLTDASRIKSASCTELPDGNVKMVIVLNDDINPEPPAEGATTCDTAVGSMFTPIMLADVHDVLENDSTVKFIVKDVAFDLTYYDCTAELVYNPTTNEIVSLDQYMHILIDIKSGKVLGMSAVGTAVLDNYMYLSDFQY